MDIPRISIPSHLFNAQQLYSAALQAITSETSKTSSLLPIRRETSLILHFLQYAPAIIVSDKFYTLEAQLTEEAIISFKKIHPDIEIKELAYNFIEVQTYEMVISSEAQFLLIKSFDILSFQPSLTFGTPEFLSKSVAMKRCLSLFKRSLIKKGISDADKSMDQIHEAITKGKAPSVIITVKPASLVLKPKGLSIKQIEEIEKRSLEMEAPMEEEHIPEKSADINLGEFINNLATSQKTAELASLSQSSLKKSTKAQSLAKETSNDIQLAISQLISSNSSEGRSKKVLDHLAGVSANDVTKEKKKLGKSIKVLKEGEIAEEETLVLTREQLKRFKEWKDLKEYEGGMDRSVKDLLNENGKMEFKFDEEPEMKKKKVDDN
jgi:hypothetical protein